MAFAFGVTAEAVWNIMPYDAKIALFQMAICVLAWYVVDFIFDLSRKARATLNAITAVVLLVTGINVAREWLTEPPRWDRFADRGTLVPLDAPNSQCSEDGRFTVSAGDGAVRTSRLPFVAMMFMDEETGRREEILVLDQAIDGSLLVSALVRARDDSVVARIHNNALVPVQGGAQRTPYWPNPQTLQVLDGAGVIMLQVKFVSACQIEVGGVFFWDSGRREVRVVPGLPIFLAHGPTWLGRVFLNELPFRF